MKDRQREEEEAHQGLGLSYVTVSLGFMDHITGTICFHKTIMAFWHVSRARRARPVFKTGSWTGLCPKCVHWKSVQLFYFENCPDA